jgi:hypothetical protein
MDNKLLAETTDAVKQVIDRFGIDILADHKRFCSAFSDFAPRLSKENKAFFVALSENVGTIFIKENSAVTGGGKPPEPIVTRAMSDITEYLNDEKAELVVRSIAGALGWQMTSAQPQETVQSPQQVFMASSSLIEDLFRRAQNGDNDAGFNLGERFFYGKGVKQDYAKAVKWYTVAADRGDCSSQKKLADCYYLGQGAERNIAKAAYRYEQAAEQGDYDSQKALIRCYLQGGSGFPPDSRRAEYYSKRYGVYADDDTAEGITKRAQLGDPNAQFRLGCMLLSGTGAEHDPPKGIYWLKQAADNGHAAALFDLGCCYYSGNGVPEDKVTAVLMFRKAAEKGDLDALNNLGSCCLQGEGTDRDPREAAENFRKAAELGHAKAQYNYGDCCYKGTGVPRNAAEALRWYREAASQGNADGQYSCGWCLEHGEGTAKDPIAAKEMYELAAAQRHPAAQKALGCCYANGTGTAKNFANAADCFQKAAAGGDKEAAELLAACYKYGGEYLAPNDARAHYYADQYGLDYDEI